MPPPGVETPVLATRFDLTIDGNTIASFSELGGITSAIDVASMSTGTGDPIQHLAGKALAPSVVLRRNMSKNIELAAWHELVILGDLAAARRSCSLTMFDAQGAAVVRYHLTDAWPQKIEILETEGSGILTETVTMMCDALQRISV
jgi:phage tail-like protein